MVEPAAPNAKGKGKGKGKDSPPHQKQQKQEGGGQVQGRVEREGREARNLVFFRVPASEASVASAASGRRSAEPPSNTGGGEGASLPPAAASVGSGASSTSGGGGGSSKGRKPSSKRPGKEASRSTTPQPRGVSGDAAAAAAAATAAAATAPSPSPPTDEGSRLRRFFSLLFRNLNRSMDELYWVCEAESSMEQSKEAAKLLESCARDFTNVRRRYLDLSWQAVFWDC